MNRIKMKVFPKYLGVNNNLTKENKGVNIGFEIAEFCKNKLFEIKEYSDMYVIQYDSAEIETDNQIVEVE